MRQNINDQIYRTEIDNWIIDGLPYKQDKKPVDAAFGIKKDGEYVVGASIVGSNGVNAMVRIRIEHPKYFTRKIIETYFNHAFNVMKLERLTSIIIGFNKKSARITEKLGFKLEGIQNRITADRQNVYYSVLWPEDCKFLKR